jgi:hypothetical protein
MNPLAQITNRVIVRMGQKKNVSAEDYEALRQAHETLEQQLKYLEEKYDEAVERFETRSK